MPVVVVANPKGGAGKSTLSTHIAGYFAASGHGVLLGDIDRQQSSNLWLRLRPPAARPIGVWPVDADAVGKPPKGTSHAVLDTPAGLHGKHLKDVLKVATHVIVPLQPSVFDIFATKPFLDELAASARAGQFKVALVGMRVDERTRAAEQLQQFVQGLGVPVLGCVRDTQNYVQATAHGLTIFDLSPSKVERDLEQWQPICQWLDAAS